MKPNRIIDFAAQWENIIFNGHGTIELMRDLQSQLIYSFEYFLTNPRYKNNKKEQNNHGE